MEIKNEARNRAREIGGLPRNSRHFLHFLPTLPLFEKAIRCANVILAGQKAINHRPVARFYDWGGKYLFRDQAFFLTNV